MAERSGKVTRTLGQRWFYSFLHVLTRFLGVLFYRLRLAGTENEPQTGGGLVCANHQSFFDPVLVGLTFQRRLNFLARDTLFKVPLLGALIRFLDAIPLDLNGSGLSGLKETLKRLKAEEFVLIFPEGTRSSDGELLRLKPGFCSVARRGNVPLIPVGIDGAYQVWPRRRKIPSLFGRIAMVVGKPITAEEVKSMTDEELVAELEQRIRTCFEEARRMRGGKPKVESQATKEAASA